MSNCKRKIKEIDRIIKSDCDDLEKIVSIFHQLDGLNITDFDDVCLQMLADTFNRIYEVVPNIANVTDYRSVVSKLEAHTLQELMTILKTMNDFLLKELF